MTRSNRDSNAHTKNHSEQMIPEQVTDWRPLLQTVYMKEKKKQQQ